MSPKSELDAMVSHAACCWTRMLLRHRVELIRIALLILSLGWLASASEKEGFGQQAVQALDAFGNVQNAAFKDPQVTLLQRYIRVERAFLSRIVELSAKQQAALDDMNSEWLSTEIDNLQGKPARGPANGAVQGILRFLGGQANVQVQQGRVLQPKDVVKKMRKQISQEVLELLTDQQRKKYEIELESRNKARAAAEAEILLSILDEHVYLSVAQRHALLPGLTNWLEGIDQDLYWQFYLQNRSYVPQVPNRVLADHLDAEQVTALSRLNRYSYERIDIEIQARQQPVNFVIDD